MATLYEISDQLLACIRTEEGDGINTETGEIIDAEALDALQMAFDKKVEGIACWIKNLKADEEALEKEEKALAKRKKAAKKKADDLKSYLQRCLAGITFETAKCKISYRSSTETVVKDFEKALKWCEGHAEDAITYQEPKLNKTVLKDLIKAGVDVAGVVLEPHNNIQIK